LKRSLGKARHRDDFPTGVTDYVIKQRVGLADFRTEMTGLAFLDGGEKKESKVRLAI